MVAAQHASLPAAPRNKFTILPCQHAAFFLVSCPVGYHCVVVIREFKWVFVHLIEK